MEKNRLISLILSNSFNFDTDILKVEDKGKRRVIDFGIDTGDSKNIAQGTLRIAINNTYTRAEACIFDVHHQIIWKDELLVKEIVKDTSLSWRNNLKYINVLDHGNDFNFYIKVTDRPKKQAKQLK